MAIISILVKHWQTALLVGAVLALGVTIRSCNQANVEKGREIERSAHLTQVVGTWQRTADSLRSAHRVDTVHATKWLTRYNGARDTVLHYKSDTTTIVQFVHTADSTIAACFTSARTCAKALAARDTLDAKKDSLHRAQLKRAAQRTTLRERVGLCVGYGVSHDGRASAFAGACVRLFP